MASRAVRVVPSFSRPAPLATRGRRRAILFRARGDYGMLLDMKAAIARTDYERSSRVCQAGVAPLFPWWRTPPGPATALDLVAVAGARSITKTGED
jgi:hypothetical protein